ncbi:cyclin-dependent kinase inhibitor 1D [Silurus asotus]|uniref:Cyclin-dependent kinase inhibitor 1D n=1 Tax=Silurus asotus TaxID=30991 RepID=A0AAD5FIB3_SILAS|nr:cyclin-dependent kinase inhibitor 1D [Silurus asotus]
MATTSSQYDQVELEGVEEDVKPRGTGVRRNLFGPVDHQQLQQDFHKFMCMRLEVAKQRWNFDFQGERPTPGSVQWEEVRCQDVPTFYHSCVMRLGKRRLVVPVSTDVTVAYRGAELGKRADKYRQSTITDFFTVKKRRCLHYKASSRQ